ncbi:LD-carboxypeptidase [Aetokthonos hydrillicola Thurmond2011]|jgi:muramoyltetrapeptide carboxypeptidase|uniref:LD-carboxypeptidase n=1 Tax=Aetokthonos hydrillicola Thurmond2011 TaxID=2712845 RepID=A0AAP5IDJ2_9CYAN|nr:LD-carboxypeptidase [Aetokthonos hydrillicola]MBO3458051.1 LD-carboxypeptidase [Aetokthonos hydrillicola CCALA 1050]MBW4587114.1 LD-carboxypeptidase [Aetokthonos hydrillicola CCALA 1050]MDR9899636.1 LD-carboxypeptidase [Aetokthonos hydrillicola Thurmond2011]
MQSKIIPPPLKPGDLLRVIAPSGAVRELEDFLRGVEIWRSRGYRVEISLEIDDKWGYLAGKDETRRHQLAEAWKDPACRGILCARGGYGSTRLLEDWTWQNSEDPKWLIGFSDVTALLWSLYNIGISSVHGPVLTTIAAEPDWSKQRLFDWVEGRSLAPLQGCGWGGGVVSGTLLPGNLTVATHLLNTPLQPSFDGVILALEDVTEAPYRIDRMLTQWRMSGELQKIRGIALGSFSRCEPPPNVPSFNVEEVLRDRLSDVNIPIVSDLPFGHDGSNAALPVGVQATLDAEHGILDITR